MIISFILAVTLFCMCGCELPPDAGLSANRQVSIDGLTIKDLEDRTAETIDTDRLLSFRILTYEIGAEGLNELQSVIERLSQRELRYREKKAFSQNGFACGTGLGDQGAEIAQLLVQIGAERRSISQMMVPAEQTEIIAAAPFQMGVPVSYMSGDGTEQMVTPPMGMGGWTVNAKPDPRLRGMVQLSVAPAFWLRGAEDLRIRLGQEPVEYHFFEEGRFLARLEERGFLVLIPNRRMPVDNTLDKVLFHIAGNKAKMRFYVIICDQAGD